MAEGEDPVEARLAAASAAVAAGDLKRVLETAFREIWSGGHWVPFAEALYHPDIVVHTINIPQPSRRGLAEVREMHTLLRTAFPDFLLTPERMVREGDTVACHLTVFGTQKGPLRGFPPTGKPTKTSEFGIWSFEGGKVKEAWIAPDISGQLRQLGHIPSGPPPRALMALMRLAQRFRERAPAR